MGAKLDTSIGQLQNRQWRPANGGPNGKANGKTNGKSRMVTNGEPESSAVLLQSAVAEVRHLTSTLAVTQRRATWSQQKVEVLVQTTSRLRTKLVRLAKLLENARHDAFHDGLTGLPNRALLLDRLGQAMILALRDKKRVALLMIDLDGFKSVNDVYGHNTGDHLLQHVAWLLNTCIRGSDTACRYGGDEFVIMLPEIEGIDCARAVVEKIHARLAASFFVEGGLIPVSASIGVALFPDDGTDCDALMKRADMLMYREKARGNAQATFGQAATCT
jgi:diguanylate cyclase (GGDEF)-like protein